LRQFKVVETLVITEEEAVGSVETARMIIDMLKEVFGKVLEG